MSSGRTLERKYGCYVNPLAHFPTKSLEIDSFIFLVKVFHSSGALWTPMRSTLITNRCDQNVPRNRLSIDKNKFNRSGEARIGHLDAGNDIISDERQVVLLGNS
ncbi:hypothetical protein ACNKHU_17000 [Shigella flexneri]